MTNRNLPDQPDFSASANASHWTRRRFLALSAATTFAGCRLTSAPKSEPDRVWEPADLVVENTTFEVEGRTAHGVMSGGQVPGKTVRLREGDDVVIRVQNRLNVDTSVHWHGLILPAAMDGVPGVSFRGIAPGETFTYRIPVRQNGTYWYHSHSGFQEQLGMFGPLIIDPAEPEPFAFDTEHVIMLSDWTFEDPMRILARLKKNPGYYNFQRPTIANDGLATILANRLKWGAMRMDPTDIADVTGATYTYLMNGQGPLSNWTGLFKPGQAVRLRLINAGTASYFDVRIPGLEMTVVQADGQNVKPVVVDELRIAIAETYDVIVSPKADKAYTIFAEAMDRSGFARGTLAPRVGMTAPVPERRKRPMLSMKQMGMGSMAGMKEASGMDASAPMTIESKGRMQTTPSEPKWSQSVSHGPETHGHGNTRVPEATRGRLDEPGIGLDNAEHRVLVYTDLKSLTARHLQHDREIEMHLTGNMERYIWGFDGKKYSEAPDPIPFQLGETLRITFVNDTMMNHPIHLHGMWMVLTNGAGPHRPRKHTINIKPAERVSVDIEVDAPGRWAMHCHILYHMDAGMFRVVEVSNKPLNAGETS